MSGPTRLFVWLTFLIEQDSTEQLGVKGLAQGRKSGGLTRTGFELTDFQSGAPTTQPPLSSYAKCQQSSKVM